eukprot:5860143-Ditylum_brightwellii.AAC.1
MSDSYKASKPPTYTRQKGGSHYNNLSPNKYFYHILKSCSSFAPKSYSNVYLFSSKQDGKAADIDDDGCVIFWKKDIFKSVKLGFLRIPSNTEKSKAVVVLTLQHLKTQMMRN